MTCKEFASSITEYMEHALPARRNAEFDEHRTGCVNCQTYFDQMNQLVSAAPLLRHKPGEVKVPAHLYELLAKKTGGASVKFPHRKLLHQRILVLGAIAVVLIGAWVYMSHRWAMLRPVPITIDLTERGHERGLGQPPRPPLMLPKAIIDLTVKLLPMSAEPGNYQVGIAPRRASLSSLHRGRRYQSTTSQPSGSSST